MAIKNATTTSDVTDAKVEDGVSAAPTYDELVARIKELSDPDMVAEVKQPSYTKLTSPTGAVTTVPDILVDQLVKSGYTKGSTAKTDSK